MAKFNIRSLLDFTPPSYLCEKCLALWEELPDWTEGERRCPVCSVAYVRAQDRVNAHLGDYLADYGHKLDFRDLIAQSRTLAQIAHAASRRNPPPPLYSLFRALTVAEKFVHFATFNTSHLLIGALKLTSHRVPVRGIVSGVDSDILAELKNYPQEAPEFDIRAYGKEVSYRDFPHQKLVIIDGLLAFKGSANLSLNGWRKAAKGREVIEVETDVEAVRELHNRYFSPVWAEMSKAGDRIVTSRIPF